MKINSDLSYNVYTTNYPIPQPYPSITVLPPTRTNVVSTNRFSNLLDNNIFSFLTNQNLNLIIGTPAILLPTVYHTGNPNSISNVYVFVNNTNYSLSNSSLIYQIANTRTFLANEFPNDLGLTLINQNLCYFKFFTDAPVPNDLVGTMRVGYLGNDIGTIELNNYFEFNQSASQDAITNQPITAVELYRRRGWYLGVEIDNIKVKNITLNNYPDISNNNFTPWNISFGQYFSNNIQAATPLNYELSIAQKPATNIVLNNFSETHTNPSLQTNFFGLRRPTTTIVSVFTIDGTFVNMDLWWRPLNTLMTWKLNYNSSSGPQQLGNSIIIQWPYLPQVSTYTISNAPLLEQTTNLLLTVLTTLYKYSRESSITPQFYIDATHNNNITYNQNIIPTPATLDISFNGQILWWDFTSITPNTEFSNTTLSKTGIDSTGGFYPDNFNSFFTSYDHSVSLTYNQLMWANGGYRAGSSQNINTIPYIDYTNFYDQNSFSTYQLIDLSGETVSLTYSPYGQYYQDNPFNPGSITSISGIYKWINLKIIKNNATPNFINISVFSGSTTLELGTDYLLFICEKAAFSSTESPYTNRSGWKDASRAFDSSLSGVARNTNGVGINTFQYTNPSSTPPSNGGPLHIFKNNLANLEMYLRIGLVNNSSNIISNITYSFTV